MYLKQHQRLKKEVWIDLVNQLQNVSRSIILSSRTVFQQMNARNLRYLPTWLAASYGALQQKEMNNWIGPIVKLVCAALGGGVVINTAAYHLGRYSLHLLVLKSSTWYTLQSQPMLRFLISFHQNAPWVDTFE